MRNGDEVVRMKGKKDLMCEELDRGMVEIEKLYARLLVSDSGPDGGGWEMRPEVKATLHRRILKEIESLRGVQRNTRIDSPQYRQVDLKIRRRVLKEIQIIIDAYLVALREKRVQEWQSMYGDIDHYRREFYYFRMDVDYENQEKTLNDYKYVEEA